MPGAKIEQTGKLANPAAYTLVHHVKGKLPIVFPPTRLMNPITFLGRTKQNDIVLNSENVSRRHAKLVVTETGITVHDLDSHNGVFLNGKKIRSSPLNVGDLLYVADICIEIQQSPDSELFGATPSTMLRREDLSEEDDSSERCLAILHRAHELALSTDHVAWGAQSMELCRELTEATVAVLAWQSSDGILDTPVALHQEKGAVRVRWPLVRTALDEQTPIFSADLRRQPVSGEPDPQGEAIGALCIVPIVQDGRGTGVIYLSRPTPSAFFTERELDVVVSIARLHALRSQQRVSMAEIGESASGDAVAWQARAETAEDRLREAHEDLHGLRERNNALESDGLKLKQQLEVERQGAIDAKREAERARAAASKLEQGLQKSDEELKKGRDALAKLEEEKAKFREQQRLVDEERRARAADADRLRETARASEAERESLRSEVANQLRTIQERNQEIHRLSEDLTRSQAANMGSVAALEQELAARTREKQEAEAALEERGRELQLLSASHAEVTAALKLAGAERARLDEALQVARAEQEQAQAALQAALQTALREREQADEAKRDAQDALRNALRTTLPPTLAEHVEALAEGAPTTTEVDVRPVAALFVTLKGFDAWASQAAAPSVKARLDHFCNSVALRVRANGGRIEQVLGHHHLVLFPADAGSVRAAVRCGLEIAALVPPEQGLGVVSAMHVASSSAGFFGEGDAATRVEAGEAVAVSRGVAAALVHEPAFYVSEAVQRLVAGDSAFSLALVGPTALLHVPPVLLFKVTHGDGRSS